MCVRKRREGENTQETETKKKEIMYMRTRSLAGLTIGSLARPTATFVSDAHFSFLLPLVDVLSLTHLYALKSISLILVWSVPINSRKRLLCLACCGVVVITKQREGTCNKVNGH